MAIYTMNYSELEEVKGKNYKVSVEHVRDFEADNLSDAKQKARKWISQRHHNEKNYFSLLLGYVAKKAI